MSFDQVSPTKLQDKMERVLGNAAAVDGDGTVGPSAQPDDCWEWAYWGFSCYSTQNGRVDIEMSYNNVTWRMLEQVAVVATIPEDRMYRCDRRYYRVTYTDLSGVASVVDLSTMRANG